MAQCPLWVIRDLAGQGPTLVLVCCYCNSGQVVGSPLCTKSGHSRVRLSLCCIKRLAIGCSPFHEEVANRFHRRARLFFHDPMPGICNNAAFNIGADLPHNCSLLRSK
jgi:hypothetical protein